MVFHLQHLQFMFSLFVVFVLILCVLSNRSEEGVFMKLLNVHHLAFPRADFDKLTVRLMDAVDCVEKKTKKQNKTTASEISSKGSVCCVFFSS